MVLCWDAVLSLTRRQFISLAPPWGKSTIELQDGFWHSTAEAEELALAVLLWYNEAYRSLCW